MSLTRRAFAAFLAGSPLIAPPFAQAAGKKNPKKPVTPEIPYSLSPCTKAQIRTRLKADVICDLVTGEVIYLSDNLKKDQLDTLAIPPASETKLEAVKEAMRRIKAGVWTAETPFSLAARFGERPRPRTLLEAVLMTLGPSLNVMDDVAASAGDDFIRAMNDHMQSIGMHRSHYLNATGLPETEEIRSKHKTTIGDLLRSIRDFELHYATPEATHAAFGINRITGIWKIAVDNIHRDQNTVSIIEDAVGKNARPVKGVSSSKSGFICDTGFMSYVRFNDPLTTRSFIIYTTGHSTAVARDEHSSRLIHQNLPQLRAFAQGEARRAAQSEIIKALPVTPSASMPVLTSPSLASSLK